MAKKKSVKKLAKKSSRTSKPTRRAKPVKSVRPSSTKRMTYRPSTNNVIASKRKISVTIWNLLIFMILTSLLVALNSITTHVGLKLLFNIFSTITGFISLAFLIILIVLIVLRLMRK